VVHVHVYVWFAIQYERENRLAQRAAVNHGGNGVVDVHVYVWFV